MTGLVYQRTNSPAIMAEWHIGLGPWIIQDGNYGDFRLGRVVEFALKYNPLSLVPALSEFLHVSRSPHAVLDIRSCRMKLFAGNAG